MQKWDISLRFLPALNKDEEMLSAKFVELASFIDELEIESREKTIGIERLEESFMWLRKGLSQFEPTSEY